MSTPSARDEARATDANRRPFGPALPTRRPRRTSQILGLRRLAGLRVRVPPTPLKSVGKQMFTSSVFLLWQRNAGSVRKVRLPHGFLVS
jgi:hypothetical protein